MKIDPVSAPLHPLAASLAPGIYPYLGGSVAADQLHAVVKACGGAVVPGKQGAKLAAKPGPVGLPTPKPFHDKSSPSSVIRTRPPSP